MTGEKNFENNNPNAILTTQLLHEDANCYLIIDHILNLQSEIYA